MTRLDGRPVDAPHALVEVRDESRRIVSRVLKGSSALLTSAATGLHRALAARGAGVPKLVEPRH